MSGFGRGPKLQRENEDLLVENEKLLGLLRASLSAIRNVGFEAWANGNTGPGGFIDEGEVLISRLHDQIQEALGDE